MKRSLWLATSLLAASALPAPAFELDGDWKVASLSVPSILEPVPGPGDALGDLTNTDRFALAQGDVTVTGNTFSGDLNGPLDGSISVNPSGEVTLVDQAAAISEFRVNATSDVIVGLETDEPGTLNLQLWVRQPAAVTLDEVAGDWNIVGLCTPSELVKTFSGGELTDLEGGDLFDLFKAPLAISTNGRFTTDIPGEGTVEGSITASGPGSLRASPEGPDAGPPFDLFLNASKDVMIATVGEADFHELLILLRVPSRTIQHELQGRWNLATYSTPAFIALERNQQDTVIGVTNADAFEATRGLVNVSPEGDAFGRLSGEVVNDASMQPGGLLGQLELQVGSVEPLIACLNADANFFVAGESEASSQQLIVGVRSIKPFGLEASLIPFSDSIEVRWVGAPNRRLQELISTDPVIWDDIQQSIGESCVILPLASDGIFRVAED